MSEEEELQEAIEYNRKYIEAQLSEELFGGDYTSAVELEASATSYKRLQQENKELKERIDKAIEYINFKLKDDYSEFMYTGVGEELLEILEGDK